MALNVACATDDGYTLLDRYFGSAGYYYIYRLESGNAEYIKSIETRRQRGKYMPMPERQRGSWVY